MSPAVDGGENGIGGFGPDEWLGLVVGFSHEAVDGGLKLDNRGEDAAFEALPGERGKQAFDGIGPGAGSRGEVESEARMARQPDGDSWVLMGGVVVEHHVDRFVGRHLTFDGIEKADELLMRWRCIQRPMTLPSRMSRAANRVVVPLRL